MMEVKDAIEYRCDSSLISFLDSPVNFYHYVCRMCKGARKRIALSCLYIGCGDLEVDMLACISEAKNQHPDLTVDILLDRERQCRASEYEKENHPLVLLAPLLCMHKNVNVSLFASPLYDRILTHFVKSPYCEMFGTMHLKVYVFDDISLVTGANLSRDYFTTRYDRYMIIDDPLFSDLMHTIVVTYQTCSFSWTPNFRIEWRSDLINPFVDATLYRHQLAIRSATLVDLLREEIAKRSNGKGDCRLKIMFQLGFSLPPFNQEEQFLFNYIQEQAKSGKYIFISTAYLNFNRALTDACTNIVGLKHRPLQVLTSDPRANTFYVSGLKMLVALFYSSSAARLLMDLSRGITGYVNDVYLEFYRYGYTYHSKGIWILPNRCEFMPGDNEQSFLERIKGPISTVIGSSNFGIRSYLRDLEMTFLFESDSPKIQDHLKHEMFTMLEYASYVAYSSVSGRLGLVNHIIHWVGRNFF